MRAIGITLGDVTGIGPEVIFKALSDRPDPTAAYVVIGDSQLIHGTAVKYGVAGAIPQWPGRLNANPGIWQLNPAETELPSELPAGAPEAAEAALVWLGAGVELSLAGELGGIVTGPVNKEAILRVGVPFIGQTEFVTERAGSPPTGMLLLGTDDRGRWLRVLLATTHLPLSRVPTAITRVGLDQTLALAERACAELGLLQRRIGVCGLNPHAGEGGYLGREEIEIIRPAVEAAQRRNPEIRGPWAADTLFHQALRGDYDLVVAMYHDQGLAPLKLVAFDTGVNWTVGLPFVRTSPDHGTAYEIAGRGLAQPSSMRAAIQLALDLVKRRSDSGLP
ncbi:MAG TPA: 4-hydroxythreonine-4-phosphate dehydrogenase PdxA [Verrucomicrobiales bacterium]|nr:4-hydroxythreonine-4-phosphate dehydrogenase PdxA [Verrucomicrobiales bacterium]